MEMTTERKIRLVQVLMPMVLDHLASEAGHNDLSADDVVDVLAIGIAAIFERDAKFTTCDDLYLASDVAGKLIAKRAMELRAAGRKVGENWLATILNDRS